MKRLAGAFSAAILLLALLPGAASAGVPGTLDQSNDPYSPPHFDSAEDDPLAQTFTAGLSGQLIAVSLNMASGATPPATTPAVALEIRATSGGYPTGAALATSSGTPALVPGDWLNFSLSQMVPVTSGVTYAIVFWTPGPTSVLKGNAYAGGQALGSSPAWAPHFAVSDYAFRTYVYQQTTALQWSAGQVVAGASTALTLTETFTFPPTNGAPVVQPNPAPAGSSVRQMALPSWFTPTGVVCSSQIAPADCILANLAISVSMMVTPNGSPVTVTISGSATPAAAAAGTVGTATAEGCVYLPDANVTPALTPVTCISGSANIAVVAAIVTPPPGTTAGIPSSGTGSSLWLLPGLVLAMIGTGLLLIRREHLIGR